MKLVKPPYLFDSSIDPTVDKTFSLRAQRLEVALLHSILAGVVNDECTLLGLFAGVAAYIHETINYPVESVNVIVPDYDFV
jgi:hypothetical protein